MIAINASLMFLQCLFLAFLMVGIVQIIVHVKRKKLQKIEYFYCPECGSKVIK